MDTKGVITIRKSKGQRTNNPQSSSQITKNRATRTSPKTKVELVCS
jgi:hypothetical protein